MDPLAEVLKSMLWKCMCGLVSFGNDSPMGYRCRNKLDELRGGSPTQARLWRESFTANEGLWGLILGGFGRVETSFGAIVASFRSELEGKRLDPGVLPS